MLKIPPSASKIYIFTGNILNLDEIKKKVGQGPADELLEVVKLLIERQPYTTSDQVEYILRQPPDELPEEELLSSVKIFLDPNEPAQSLKQALHKVNAEIVLSQNDSVIVSYDTRNNLEELIQVWSLLEDFSASKQLRIGLCDVETQLFIQFYGLVKMKPNIFQINLASCCVVPPQLQEFTKQNDVQLLTHNDSLGLIEDGLLDENSKSVRVSWAVRYQTYIKCRGVLTTKGYMLSLDVSAKQVSDKS